MIHLKLVLETFYLKVYFDGFLNFVNNSYEFCQGTVCNASTVSTTS